MSIDFTVKVEVPENIISTFGLDNDEFQAMLTKAIRYCCSSDLYSGNTLWVEFDDYNKAVSCEKALHDLIAHFDAKIQNPPMTNEEFVFIGGSKCPNCGSSDFNCSELHLDGSDVWQDCICIDCLASWTDEFELTGYTNFKTK
jgi:hypothetical protein